jgi:hypothetical protein
MAQVEQAALQAGLLENVAEQVHAGIVARTPSSRTQRQIK